MRDREKAGLKRLVKGIIAVALYVAANRLRQKGVDPDAVVSAVQGVVANWPQELVVGLILAAEKWARWQ